MGGIMSYLSYPDLYNWREGGYDYDETTRRLRDCSVRVLEKKPFKIAIIGGYNAKWLHDVEVIAINKDSISHINSSIPPLQKGIRGLRGVLLPDYPGNLVISGGWTKFGRNDKYLHYKEGFNHWRKVGTMKKARNYHSSIWIDGRLLTTGGRDTSIRTTSHHEELSLDGNVKEMKEMPIALMSHTATIFDQNKMIVCGGRDEKRVYSQRTFIYDTTENIWNEGPSLLEARCNHSSCTIEADDGSTQSIIVIGGSTYKEYYSKTTEILDMTNFKWMQGPKLPIGIRKASSVALPPTSKFICVVIGGLSEKEESSSIVYGLNRSSKEWTLLGKIKTGRWGHIALPLS